MTPAELLAVVGNINQRSAKWQAKVRLIQAIGIYDEPVQIGLRDLCDRVGSTGHNRIARLLEELVEARVVTLLELGAGRRASVYEINPSIERWAKVPWRRELHSVQWLAFHVAPESSTKPGLRAAGAHSTRANPDLRAAGAHSTRATGKQRAHSAHSTRANGTQRAAGGHNARATSGAEGPIGPLARAQRAAAAQEESPNSGETTQAPPTGPQEEAARMLKRVRATVLYAARADHRGQKFLNGAPATMLAELVAEHGAETVISWTTEAPKDLGVPRLVEWLTDRPYLPDVELLAMLDARPDPEPAPPPAEPAPAAGPGPDRPRLPDWVPPEVEDVDPEAAAAARLAARAALSRPMSPPDGRMVDA